ncbi:DUF4342 domain-containing protein [bacterium]|nr:MAG: DUF4342 domain-containing protein [bacterium]
MSQRKEEFKVSGEQLLAQVKRLIAEGNVRRITIKNKDGKTIVELPLTLGVVGAVLAPPLAAVGAIAALVTECSIVVERDTSEPTEGEVVDKVTK